MFASHYALCFTLTELREMILTENTVSLFCIASLLNVVSYSSCGFAHCPLYELLYMIHLFPLAGKYKAVTRPAFTTRFKHPHLKSTPFFTELNLRMCKRKGEMSERHLPRVHHEHLLIMENVQPYQ